MPSPALLAMLAAASAICANAQVDAPAGVAVAAAPAVGGAEVPPCAGLTIGTREGAADVIDDGYTLAKWAFGRSEGSVTVPAGVRVAARRAQRGLPGSGNGSQC